MCRTEMRKKMSDRTKKTVVLVRMVNEKENAGQRRKQKHTHVPRVRRRGSAVSCRLPVKMRRKEGKHGPEREILKKDSVVWLRRTPS